MLTEAQRRPATILMADISGYSGLSETIEADWLYEILNDVLHDLSECLIEHGAHIDKYVGDEIIALFGVPTFAEDAADRAVLAAQAMRESMQQLNARNQGLTGHDLHLHVGINVGIVIAGRVGHAQAGAYSVIGDAVNIAKRLETEAPAGEIYLSAAVKDRLRGRYELEALGPLQVHGRQATVEVYRLVGQAIAPQAPLALDRATWVERERPMAELRRAAQACADGGASCVLIVGEQGAGKTALARRFLRLRTDDGDRVAEVTCTPFASQVPHWAMADLAVLLACHLASSPSPTTDDLAQALQEAFSGEEACREVILELLSLRRHDPLQRRAVEPGAVAQAIQALLARASRDCPLVLLVDNAQWLDEASTQVLSRLRPEATQGRVLWLFCARTQESVAVPARWVVRRVEIPPLLDAEATALLETLPGAGSLSHSLRRSLMRRAEGNALQLIEMARWLNVERRGGAAAATEAPLSLSLHEMLLARIEALPDPLPLVLQACAVVGEPILPSLLHQLVPSSVASPEALRQLVEHGLLSSGPQAGEFGFASRLAAEVAYDAIPAPRRRALHGRIAEHLSQLQPDALNTHRLARHAFYAGWGERSIPYLMQSAERYAQEYASRECERAVQQAIEAMSGAADPSAWYGDRARALLLLARAQHVLGALDQAQAALIEADALASEVGDDRLRAEVSLNTGTNALMARRWDEAVDAYGAAARAYATLGDRARQAQAVLGTGMAEMEQGSLSTALRSFREASEIGYDERWIRSAALNNMGHILVRLGDLGRAHRLLLEAEGLIRVEGDRRGLAYCYASLGELHFAAGHAGDGIPWLKQSLELAMDIEDPQCICQAAAVLARCYLACGDSARATDVIGRTTMYCEAVTDQWALQHLYAARAALGHAS